MEAFVYCLTDHKSKKIYVGSHKGSENDGYICSSGIVLEQIKLRPNDFTRQIISSGSWSDMRSLESAILKADDAKNNQAYYNCHNNSPEFCFKQHTLESKEKISKANKGRKRPDLSLRNRENNPSKKGRKRQRYWASTLGKKHTEKTKQLISEKNRGEKNGNYGRKFSPETIAKMAEARRKYWKTKHADIQTISRRTVQNSP